MPSISFQRYRPYPFLLETHQIHGKCKTPSTSQKMSSNIWVFSWIENSLVDSTWRFRKRESLQLEAVLLNIIVSHPLFRGVLREISGAISLLKSKNKKVILNSKHLNVKELIILFFDYLSRELQHLHSKARNTWRLCSATTFLLMASLLAKVLWKKLQCFQENDFIASWTRTAKNIIENCSPGA